MTYLKRMQDKGVVICSNGKDTKMFSPAFSRKEAALDESKRFIERVHHGSLSMMISFLAQKQKLSEDEINQLEKILERTKKENDN